MVEINVKTVSALLVITVFAVAFVLAYQTNMFQVPTGSGSDVPQTTTPPPTMTPTPVPPTPTPTPVSTLSPIPTETPTPSYSPSPTPDSNTVPISVWNLTLTGASGTKQVLSKSDIMSMSPLTYSGGLKNSTNAVLSIGTYTGVSLVSLCNLVGGLSSSSVVVVTASDGYQGTFSYAQVHDGANFNTYDTDANSVLHNEPLTVLLAYSYNGEALPSDWGVMRVVVLGSEGLITNGNTWVRLVTSIQVIG
jgi:DMSO/TMAO reductase YedYZ molybdopterin-dependent catalytic subunit